MIALFFLFLTLSVSPFKSKSRLEAENAALRHQLIVLQRRVRGRVQLTNGDRLFLVLLYRWFPSVLRAITIRGRQRIVGFFRANRYQRSARCLDLRQDLLKRLKFKVAVRAPAAAVEGYDDRTFLPQRGDVDDLSLCITQHERWRVIAHFQHGPSDDTVAQLLDVTLHDRLTVS